MALLEGQLTWLAHIVGAIVRGRLSSSSADAQETIDGDLAARVFGLLQARAAVVPACPPTPHRTSSTRASDDVV